MGYIECLIKGCGTIHIFLHVHMVTCCCEQIEADLHSQTTGSYALKHKDFFSKKYSYSHSVYCTIIGCIDGINDTVFNSVYFFGKLALI